MKEKLPNIFVFAPDLYCDNPASEYETCIVCIDTLWIYKVIRRLNLPLPFCVLETIKKLLSMSYAVFLLKFVFYHADSELFKWR